MKKKLISSVAGTLVFVFFNPLFAQDERFGVRASGQFSAWSEMKRKVSQAEREVLASSSSQKNPQLQLNQIKKLIQLLHQEKQQGEKRMRELEVAVSALEERKGFLQERMMTQSRSLRQFLIAVDTSSRSEHGTAVRGVHLPEQEKWEAPRRKLLTNLVTFGVKEVEVLKVDLADAAQVEEKIQEEKHELAYLFQDLKEQESILELNRQLQVDLLHRKKSERWAHFENYRKVKDSEGQVENLVGSLNARQELAQVTESEKKTAHSVDSIRFAHQRGKLVFPVEGGKVLTSFGRTFDAQTGLYLFKKGVEISVNQNQEVRSISSGQVAYVGELPTYGQVMIVDHGDHYYSLMSHLGDFTKKVHDRVEAGEVIGKSDNSGNPLYFEIRSRNVAVNPLQWLTN